MINHIAKDNIYLIPMIDFLKMKNNNLISTVKAWLDVTNFEYKTYIVNLLNMQINILKSIWLTKSFILSFNKKYNILNDNILLNYFAILNNT